MAQTRKHWIRHTTKALAGLLAGGLAAGVLGALLGIFIGWLRDYGADNWWPVLLPMFGGPIGALLGMTVGIGRSLHHERREASNG